MLQLLLRRGEIAVRVGDVVRHRIEGLADIADVVGAIDGRTRIALAGGKRPHRVGKVADRAHDLPPHQQVRDRDHQHDGDRGREAEQQQGLGRAAGDAGDRRHDIVAPAGLRQRAHQHRHRLAIQVRPAPPRRLPRARRTPPARADRVVERAPRLAGQLVLLQRALPFAGDDGIAIGIDQEMLGARQLVRAHQPLHQLADEQIVADRSDPRAVEIEGANRADDPGAQYRIIAGVGPAQRALRDWSLDRPG